VIRQGIRAVLFALAFAGCSAGAAAAASPEGAQLALLEYYHPGIVSLFAPAVGSGERGNLFSASVRTPPAPDPFGLLSWSPDGSRLAFVAFVGERRGPHRARPRREIYVVRVDGREGRGHPVQSTSEGRSPVFSPDGHTLAFAKRREVWRLKGRSAERLAYGSESVWLEELRDGTLRQLTPWRNGLYNAPSSFSPDGEELAMTRRTGEEGFGDAIAMDLGSGDVTVLAANAREPHYSPDGGKIAYMGGQYSAVAVGSGSQVFAQTDLFAMNRDGSEPQQLSATPTAIELAPSWDSLGSHLVYTGINEIDTRAGARGLGDSIIDLDLQTGCSRTLASMPKIVYFGATWRPGPGREAAPIPC
jgi:dipeptidyl aminopeptidase/acylaminoacyl peptidase